MYNLSTSTILYIYSPLTEKHEQLLQTYAQIFIGHDDLVPRSDHYRVTSNGRMGNTQLKRQSWSNLLVEMKSTFPKYHKP